MMRLNLEKVQDLFKVDNRVIFSTSVLVRKMVDIISRRVGTAHQSPRRQWWAVPTLQFAAWIWRAKVSIILLTITYFLNFYGSQTAQSRKKEIQISRELLRFISTFVMLFLCASANVAQTPKHFKIEALLDDADAQLQKQSNRWALIIGIDKYDNDEINPLRYAVADAKALYQLLIDPDRGQFSTDKVRLLTSDVSDRRLRPTEANILHALRKWLVREVKEDDTVLIFFSGHGYFDGERKYLLPVDTDTFYVPAYAIDNREFIEAID